MPVACTAGFFIEIMDVIKERNEKLGAKLVKELTRRHYDAFYCKTADEAKAKVLELIPEGSSISWGGSMTVRDLGITKALHEGNYRVIDRDLATSPEEIKDMYHQALSADYFLSSVNAITEDGLIVNIDGRGNRVAAITYGPEKVIFVVGMNKVVKNIDEAMLRARNTTAPINNQRFNNLNPCKIDGACHNCNTPTCICNYIEIMRNSFPEHRHAVVLVDENLGY